MSLSALVRAGVCIFGVSLAACGGEDEPAAGSGDRADAGGTAGSPAAGGGDEVDRFSFFVTSWAALQRLSKSPNGFGGDLRYGEADGLRGADEICREIAEASLAGSGKKTWRA